MQNGDFAFNHKLYLTVPIVAAYHALVLQLAAITSVDSVDIGREDNDKQLPEVMQQKYWPIKFTSSYNIEITCITNEINVALTLLLFRIQFSLNLT